MTGAVLTMRAEQPFRAGGGAVIGVERGFALEEPDGTVRHLDQLSSEESVRMNEGGCDPEQRFWSWH